MREQLRRYGLTIALALLTIGLGYWTWLAYQDLQSILETVFLR